MGPRFPSAAVQRQLLRGTQAGSWGVRPTQEEEVASEFRQRSKAVYP